MNWGMMKDLLRPEWRAEQHGREMASEMSKVTQCRPDLLSIYSQRDVSSEGSNLILPYREALDSE